MLLRQCDGGPLAGWQEVRGALGALTRDSIMKPEKEHIKLPTVSRDPAVNHLLRSNTTSV